MGRVLKFRAWNPYQSRMMPPVSAYGLHQYPSQCFDFLMQFTGLLDKNGKEIYEGEVMTPEFYKNMKDPKFKCVVGFQKGMFCFGLNGGLIQDIKPLYRSLAIAEKAGAPYVSIGNIHEHPELLEQK